jgi:hypothetical protein
VDHKFKVGDIVRCKETAGVRIGRIYRIRELKRPAVDYSPRYLVTDLMTNKNIGGDLGFRERRFEPL